MRNALAHAHKGQREMIAAMIRTAFAQPDYDAAVLQWRQVADNLRPKVEKLAALMDAAGADVLAFMTFPKELRAKLHSTDEMDKRKPANCATFSWRGRPRGEERCAGWEHRQAALFKPCRFEASVHSDLWAVGFSIVRRRARNSVSPFWRSPSPGCAAP